MRELLAWGLVALGLVGLALAARPWRVHTARRFMRVTATAIALTGVVLVYGLHSHSGPQAQLNPIARDPASIGRGTAVYAVECAPCHGVDARGGGPHAALLQPPPSDLVAHVPLHGDAELFGWIAGGFPQSAMPAFYGRLTEAQMWDVLNYLRSIAAAPTR